MGRELQPTTLIEKMTPEERKYQEHILRLKDKGFEHKFCQQNSDFYGYTVFTIDGVRFVTEKDARHIIEKIKKGMK